MPTNYKCRSCKQYLGEPDLVNGVFYFVCAACGTVWEVAQRDRVVGLQSQFDRFESEYDVVLPDALKALFRMADGSDRASYEMDVDAVASSALAYYSDQGLLHIHGFMSLDPLHEMSMFETRALIAEWGLPEGIVLLSGDGHSWVALDYRNASKEPPVIFVESESGRTELLAPNFENFLQRLKRLA